MQICAPHPARWTPSVALALLSLVAACSSDTRSTATPGGDASVTPDSQVIADGSGASGQDSASDAPTSADIAASEDAITSTDGGAIPDGHRGPDDATAPDGATDAGCTPSCSPTACGDDGCGGQCGPCPSGASCVADACVSAPPGGSSVPAAEALVRVTGPGQELGRSGWAHTTEASIALRGVLFGEVDALTWTGPGGAGGDIALSDRWTSAPVPLAPGDNPIDVTAWRDGAAVATDRVTVIRNPDGTSIARPRAVPDTAWIGETRWIRVQMRVPGAVAWTATAHLLLEGGASPVASLRDNGNLADGDTVYDDGVFSGLFTVSCTEPGARRYRARMSGTVDGVQKEAWSAPVTVSCFSRVDPEMVTAHVALISTAESALAAGEPAQDVLQAAQADPQVLSAGLPSGDGYGLWIQFTDGTLGAVFAAPEGTR